MIKNCGKLFMISLNFVVKFTKKIIFFVKKTILLRACLNRCSLTQAVGDTYGLLLAVESGVLC